MVRRRRSSNPKGEEADTADSASNKAAMLSNTSGEKHEQMLEASTTKQGAAMSGSQGGLFWSHMLSGKAGSLPIVFTKDGQYFFVAVASTVRIYSTQSGVLVSTLSARAHASASKLPLSHGAHTSTITGLLVNPKNPAQLITSSLDGTIKVWDYLDAHMLRSISLDFPVTNMCAHAKLPDEVIVALRKPRGKDGESNGSSQRSSTNVIIQKVSLHASKKQSVRVRLGKVRSVTDMSVSADGRFVVIVGGRKMYVAQLENRDAGLARFLTDKLLTRVVFHPIDNTFATGHENGQIRLWYFLNDETYTTQLSTASQAMQLAPNTVLHWHAHAVSALRFNENGSTLISGGEESTLVLWQTATQSKEFVPRLGGSRIMSISTLKGQQGQQDQMVAAMHDGSVSFIGVVNLKVLRSLPGVLASSSLQQTLSSSFNASLDPCIPLAIEPDTTHLVTMAGHPSTLQFIAAASDDAQVMQVEVVPSNRISRPDDQPIEQARVEHVCFAAHREWMATVDRKASGEFSLKIWQWNAKSQTYVVNTRIEEPHGQGAQITALAFSPRPYASMSQSPLLVSAGTDNKCRVWRCMIREEKRQRLSNWVARSTFDRRSHSIRAFAFSLDGSLIALVHEKSMSLWDPETNSEVHSIALQAGPSIAVCSIAFLPKHGGRYLALVDDMALTVVDVAQGTIKFVERTANAIGVLALSSIQHSADLALVTSEPDAESKIELRSIDLEQPKEVLSLPFSITKALDGALVQEADDGKLRFFAVTTDYDVVFVSQENVTKRVGGDGERLQSNGRQRLRTIYDELLGPVGVDEKATDLSQRRFTPRLADRKQNLGSLFAVPSHLLPPAHLLFETFVQMALPGKVEAAKEDVGSPTDVSEVLSSSESMAKNDSIGTGQESQSQKLADIAALDMKDVADMFADLAMDSALPGGTEINSNGSGNLANGAEDVPSTMKKPSKKERKARSSQNHTSPAKVDAVDPQSSAMQSPVAVDEKGDGRKRKISNA